jgi:hypothetical protein
MLASRSIVTPAACEQFVLKSKHNHGNRMQYRNHSHPALLFPQYSIAKLVTLFLELGYYLTSKIYKLFHWYCSAYLAFLVYFYLEYSYL